MANINGSSLVCSSACIAKAGVLLLGGMIIANAVTYPILTIALVAFGLIAKAYETAKESTVLPLERVNLRSKVNEALNSTENPILPATLIAIIFEYTGLYFQNKPLDSTFNVLHQLLHNISDVPESSSKIIENGPPESTAQEDRRLDEFDKHPNSRIFLMRKTRGDIGGKTTCELKLYIRSNIYTKMDWKHLIISILPSEDQTAWTWSTGRFVYKQDHKNRGGAVSHVVRDDDALKDLKKLCQTDHIEKGSLTDFNTHMGGMRYYCLADLLEHFPDFKILPSSSTPSEARPQ